MINLKILFKNTTKYSKEIYKSFLQFHIKKFRNSYLLYTLVIFLLFLFLIFSLIQYKNFATAVTIIIALLIFFIYRYIQPINIVKKELESEKIQKEQSFTFKFYDTHFSVENRHEIQNANYSKLYRVYKYKSFYYLYIDKTHAYILDKNSFNQNEHLFSSFLKEKVNIFKYRIKDMKKEK